MLDPVLRLRDRLRGIRGLGPRVDRHRPLQHGRQARSRTSRKAVRNTCMGVNPPRGQAHPLRHRAPEAHEERPVGALREAGRSLRGLLDTLPLPRAHSRSHPSALEGRRRPHRQSPAACVRTATRRRGTARMLFFWHGSAKRASCRIATPFTETGSIEPMRLCEVDGCIDGKPASRACASVITRPGAEDAPSSHSRRPCRSNARLTVAPTRFAPRASARFTTTGIWSASLSV